MALAVVEPNADVLVGKPIGDDQVDVVVTIDINTSNFETQNIVVKNSKGGGRCVAAQFQLDLIKIAIFGRAQTLAFSEVRHVVTIQIGQHPL